ncbi:kinesin-like protein Klp8 [Ascosphaera aggregata]|nr:kinesin-like protein Klp8 [Ascosphaera aggregata]
MGKLVVFQFAIVDFGHVGVSAYDLVRGGLPDEDDIALEDAKKPCVGVRIIDFSNSAIYLWSLEKLAKRVQMMRRMHQYIDRPDYIRHFRLENTFGETYSQQQYSLIGDADVPLAAVFESTVQDFALEVISPYTQSVVGIIRLSLEPSSAEAPLSTLKFNVVMRDMIGFAEHEGTDVHAQLSIPGIDEHAGAGGGATTTSMMAGFDETPIRFESVHGMSLPLDSPRTATLKVTVYARITAMHLEKLISWDQIRDAPEGPPEKRRSPRIAESEFYSEERNDVFARVQILELAESGRYLPVEVTLTGPLDSGTYQLHQGLQRRIAIHLTHSAGENLPWANVTNLKVGNIRLLDPYGKVPDMDVHSPDVHLKLTREPLVKDNADGTTNVSIIGQWDSSLHSSQLLDRITQDKYKVELTLSWHLVSPKVQDPIVFEMDLRSQILARSYVRPQSMFKQFWSSARLAHSISGIFSIVVRPVSAKRAADLWRMNTLNDYVKGEELLVNWAPRKVSLIRDFFQAQKRRKRIIEIEAARGKLGPRISVPYLKGRTATSRDSRDALVRKYLSLWRPEKDPIEKILITDHTEPPLNGAAFAPTAGGIHNANSDSSSGTPWNSNPGSSATSASASATSTCDSWSSQLSSKPRFVAAIQHLPKNPTSIKSGFLFMPDDTYSHWVRRFVDLRVPYLHIHSVPGGDEINAINIAKSHVDHQPDFARLLDECDIGGMGRVGLPGMRFRPNVFAIYSPENTFLFATRTEALKIEWILKIDQSYFSSRTPVARPKPARIDRVLRKAGALRSDLR